MIFEKPNQQNFFCNNHPNVKAVTFCETCAAMPGCTGYWCADCDNLVHKMFPGHQRTTPRVHERKMCDKHPDQNAEMIFCWETKTFHCPLCACERGLKGDTIPTAIDKCIEDSKTELGQLNDSIEKLSERKNKILFELDGENNPQNLEKQMDEALRSIKTTFDRLRELIEQREKTLLEKVEKEFNERIEQFTKEAAEISEVIDRGNEVIQTFNTLLPVPENKSANSLKKIIGIKIETERAVDMVKKFEADSLLSVTTKVLFEGIDSITEGIENLCEITRTTNIPAPQEFKTTDITCNDISLSWDPIPERVPSISYQVLYTETFEDDDKWKECYRGTETECRCSNLKSGTSYSFKITTIFKEIASINHSICFTRTV